MIHEPPLPSAQMQNHVHWFPPPHTLPFRALFHDIGLAVIGVVIRDYEGQVIGALLERMILPPIVDDVEALFFLSCET